MNKVTVEAQMMIRKPVAEVFEAFVDPEITVNFWFTKSSNRLEPLRKWILVIPMWLSRITVLRKREMI